MNPGPEYKKGPTSTGGVEFEVKLQTVFALGALENLKDWKLSNEHKEAQKFNDLVCESGFGEILLQAKVKGRALTRQQFLDISPNADFGLAKYFLSYKSLQGFKNPCLILCVNSTVPLDIFKKVEETTEIRVDTIAKIISNNCQIYTIQSTLNAEVLKAVLELQSKLEKKDENYKTWKNLVVAETDVYHFFKIFFCVRISEADIEKSIEKKLLHLKPTIAHPISSYAYVTTHMRTWCNTPREKAKYMTELYLKSILHAERNTNVLKSFLENQVSFRGSYFDEQFQITYIKVSDSVELNVRKAFDSLWKMYKSKNMLYMFFNEILFLSTEVQQVVKEAVKYFEVPTYKYLIISMCQEDNNEVHNVIMNIIKKNSNSGKKVFILGEQLHANDICQKTITIEDNITFQNLDDESQRKALDKQINFQGHRIKFKDLIDKCNNYNYFNMDGMTVLKLLNNDEYTIGKSLLPFGKIENYYRNRHLRNEEEAFSEEYILDKFKKKIIILSGPAGTGKTTFLSKLAHNWKQRNPYKWIMIVDLQDILTNMDNRSTDLLSYLEGADHGIERQLFENLEKVIILDGIDELNSEEFHQIHKLILDYLININNTTNIIISTRNYGFIMSDLCVIENSESLVLEPFSKDDQKYVFKNYLHNKAEISIDNDELENMFEQLEIYIEQLTDTPLFLRMMADIYAKNKKISFRSKLNTKYQFYKFFVDKIKEIFMERNGGPALHSKMKTYKSDRFDQYIKDLTLVALRKTFPPNVLQHLNISQEITLTHTYKDLLETGILEDIKDKCIFIHNSFAEYFSAQFTCKKMLDSCKQLQDSSFKPIFFENILNLIFLDNQYLGISSFLDDMLELSDHLSGKSYLFSNLMDNIDWNENKNLCHLSLQGCINIIKLLLDNYADSPTVINTRRSTGETAFLLSAHYPSLLKYFIEKGANIDEQDDLGFTIFHYCTVMICDPMRYKLYLNTYYSDIKEGNYFAFLKTSIEIELGKKKLDIKHVKPRQINQEVAVELMIYLKEKGLTILNTENDQGVVWVIMFNSIELLKYLVETCNHNLKIDSDYSAMHFAVVADSIEIVQYLIQKDFKTDILDKSQATLLHHAAFHKSKKVLTYLIERCNMNPSICDDVGRTCIHCAASGDAVDIIRYLESRGISLVTPYALGGTLVHAAAYGGAINALKYLKSKKCNLHSTNNLGNTVVHEAAMGNSVEVIKYVVGHGGPHINLRNKDGQTPLHCAAWHGSLDVLKYFKGIGIDFNSVDNNGNTVMHKAVEGGSLNAVKYLKDNNIEYKRSNNDGMTPLHYAAYFNKVDIIKYFKEIGINLRPEADSKNTSHHGTSLVHYAAQGNSLETLKYLLNFCDFKSTDKNLEGATPLHRAALFSAFDVLVYFKEIQSDFWIEDEKGDTVMHYAALGNSRKIVEYLVKNNCSSMIDKKNGMGYIPLHYAVRCDGMEVLHYFEGNGADTNVLDEEDNTLAHHAAATASLEVLNYLNQYVCLKINAKNKDGTTPVQYAAQNGRLSVVEYFKNNIFGCNFRTTDNLGNTVVHAAAQGNSVEIIKYVVGHCGLELNWKNNSGEVPLHCASRHGSLDVLKYFKEIGVDFNVVDNSGETVVHKAVKGSSFNAVDVIKYFEEIGINLQSKDYSGNTILHVAAKGNVIDAFIYLIDSCGFKLQVVNKNGELPLHLAAQQEAIDILQYCRRKGADFHAVDTMGDTIVHYAVKGNSLLTLIYLIYNCNIDINMTLRGNLFGITPLHYAAHSNNLAIIKYLIMKQVNVNSKDFKGKSLIHCAALGNSLEVLTYLIKNRNLTKNQHYASRHTAAKYEALDSEGNRVDFKAIDNNGNTVIHYAAQGNSVEVIKFLMNNCDLRIYDKNKTGKQNYTCLYYNKANNDTKMKEHLTRHNCSALFNIKNRFGETPLHTALRYAAKDVLYYFEFIEIDFDVKDNAGNTVVHFAASGDSIEILTRLNNRHMKMDVPNNKLQTPLFTAAFFNAVNALKYFNQIGMNFQSRDYLQCTALHYAAMGNAIEAFRYLIDSCGVELNIPNKDGELPLHFAAQKGALEILEYYKQKNVSFKLVDNSGATVVHHAVVGESLLTIIYLIKTCNLDMSVVTNGNKNGDTPLHYAARHNNLAIIKYLKLTGLNFNMKNNDGNSLVHSAAQGNSLETMNYLINVCDLKITDTNQDGATPLHFAALFNAFDVLVYFKETKSIFSIEDIIGDTVMFWAAANNFKKIVEFLVNNCDMNIDKINKLGYTALHYAARCDGIEVFRYLTDVGADINILDEQCNTLAHHAATTNSFEVLKYLTHNCCLTMNAKNICGATPLQYAAQKGSLNIIEYFKNDNAVDFTVIDIKGDTVLHYAVKSNTLEVINYLVNICNLKLDTCNRYEETPLHYAIQQERFDIIEHFKGNKYETI